MPDSYVIDPSEFVPATPAKSGKAPIKINPADFKPATSGLAGPTAISGGSSDGYDKNWFDTHTQNLAQHAYHFLASKGHPDLGEAVHRFISGIGPHNLTEAATMGVSAAMPLAGKAAGALEEAAPLVSKGLELLDAPGLKGAAARTAVTAATGAATGGVPGAEQGAILQAAGEPLAPVASKVTGAGVADQAAQDAMRENAIDTVSHKALENELGMTTGQAQKLGMHRRQLLHKVDTIAVHAILVSWREERNQFEPNGCRFRNGEQQVIVRTYRNHAGLQRIAVLFPLAGNSRNSGLCCDNAAQIVDQADGNGNARTIGLRPERARVSGAGTNRDSPVAFVFDSGGLCFTCPFNHYFYAARNIFAGSS